MAEVSQDPGCRSEYAKLSVLAYQIQKTPKSASIQNIVTAFRAAPCNVAQSPESVFLNIGLMAAKMFCKDRNSTASLNNSLGLLSCAAGIADQNPGSFK